MKIRETKFKVGDIITNGIVIYTITEIFYDYKTKEYCYCVCRAGYSEIIDKTIKNGKFMKIN